MLKTAIATVLLISSCTAVYADELASVEDIAVAEAFGGACPSGGDFQTLASLALLARARRDHVKVSDIVSQVDEKVPEYSELLANLAPAKLNSVCAMMRNKVTQNLAESRQ